MPRPIVKAAAAPAAALTEPSAAPAATPAAAPSPVSPEPAVRVEPLAAPEPIAAPAPLAAPLAAIPVATPSMARSPAAALAAEEASVRQVLRTYAEAYGELDVGAAAEIWPTVDRRALARAFATLKSQDVAFESCEVQTGPASAVARCRGTVQYVRKIGAPTPHIEAQEWLITMQKLGGDWKIDRVSASHGSFN